ncbi:MAG: alpha-ribazole phosphatase family protein [Gammaproteobacteria bacterium]|nr:alpha-ribazole phosphatase family protein [Gammaproteobacteria bacterium]MCF6231023.1 alpha-ribazole phosphatase family protein [Gammaproteobacteria bacterium]
MSDYLCTTIDLIRHGEPVGGKRYRGHLDDPLSDKGWSQMRAAIAEHHPWSAIVSSSLQRCAAYAEEVANRYQLPLTRDARLMELGFGEWEGKTAQQLMTETPHALNSFWRDPIKNPPPGGETLACFRTRILQGWRNAIAQHQGEHILMVGHAGMMRMIIREVLGMPLENMFRLDIPNAGITRISIDHNENGDLPRLHFHAGQL